MAQALQNNRSPSPFEKLDPDLTGKILSFVSEDATSIFLTRVSRTFHAAMRVAMWEEWIIDETQPGRTRAEGAITMMTSLFPYSIPIEELFKRIVRLKDEFMEHVDSLWPQNTLEQTAVEPLNEQAAQIQHPTDALAFLDHAHQRIGRAAQRATILKRQERLLHVKVNVLNRVLACHHWLVSQAANELVSKKWIERVVADLRKGRGLSESELVEQFSDEGPFKAESSLVTRATRIMTADLKARDVEIDISACFAKLYEEQRTEICSTPTGQELFQRAIQKWGGAISLERFLDFERIVLKVAETRSPAQSDQPGTTIPQSGVNAPNTPHDVVTSVTSLPLNVERLQEALDPSFPAPVNPRAHTFDVPMVPPLEDQSRGFLSYLVRFGDVALAVVLTIAFTPVWLLQRLGRLLFGA